MRARRGDPRESDLATYCIGSDRYAYTVIEVASNGRWIRLQRRRVRRVDGNGQSEDQRYISIEDPQGKIEVATRRWIPDGDGHEEPIYCPKGSRTGKGGYYVFGYADSYRDPSF